MSCERQRVRQSCSSRSRALSGQSERRTHALGCGTTCAGRVVERRERDLLRQLEDGDVVADLLVDDGGRVVVGCRDVEAESQLELHSTRGDSAWRRRRTRRAEPPLEPSGGDACSTAATLRRSSHEVLRVLHCVLRSSTAGSEPWTASSRSQRAIAPASAHASHTPPPPLWPSREEGRGNETYGLPSRTRSRA